jgi:hypothetical protein
MRPGLAAITRFILVASSNRVPSRWKAMPMSLSVRTFEPEPPSGWLNIERSWFCSERTAGSPLSTAPVRVSAL